MKKHIVIAGSGFSGAWAAFSAARAVALAGKTGQIEITVVSPQAALHIRPRLYEATLEGMAPDLSAVFGAVGVRHLRGRVEAIDSEARQVVVRGADGSQQPLDYDRFVLAAGSQVVRPPLPGLSRFAFDVDQLDGARALERHLAGLASRPASPSRNTVVIAGAGFTGL